MSDDVYTQEMDRADWLVDAGQYERAVQILGRLLAGYPDNAGRTYKALAAAHNSVDRLEDSEAAARRAVAALPNDHNAHRLLAYALIFQNREPEAERSLRTALELAPEDDSLFYLMSTALTRMERTEEALFYAREAVRLSPESADSHAVLAWAQMKTDPETAETALQEALALDPVNEDALLLQFQVLDRRRNYRGATKALAAYTAQTSHHETARNAVDAFLVKGIAFAHIGLFVCVLLLLTLLALVRIADLSSWLLLPPLILTAALTYRTTAARIQSFRLAFTNRSRRILRSFIRHHPFLSLWTAAVAVLWVGLAVGFVRTIQGNDVVLISAAGATFGLTALYCVCISLTNRHRRRSS
ncbi:tetratricopeptide repeat protein [Actinomyces viscosus]|uniref:Predicted O-linked N-acetylglucosamine transferase, SPINDLY family n=1 Tax=Actinomyces viscosus TaxID=1656 RepID=A0A448PNZ6_ACTVI|nr:tetratricopeptide repeat protein [Actinomyces viscosus]TFH53320.1 tetratricopeptide repeat protein [Actinomyces viscosus]VEI18021.1 Predicted O-linked N-acetylglucosamine transferase, SPINDLY family [Actinomyces viscosus]